MGQKLSKAVAEKYDLVDMEPGSIFHAKYGRLDFTTMDLATADLLYKEKLPYLKLKPKKKEADEKPEAD
jgi:hypothetical protein